VRDLKLFMEEKCGCLIDLHSPVLPWLARHAAWVISGFRKQADGHHPTFAFTVVRE
jgi:hypothetical protein